MCAALSERDKIVAHRNDSGFLTEISDRGRSILFAMAVCFLEQAVEERCTVMVRDVSAAMPEETAAILLIHAGGAKARAYGTPKIVHAAAGPADPPRARGHAESNMRRTGLSR